MNRSVGADLVAGAIAVTAGRFFADREAVCAGLLAERPAAG